jgi:hypothetical protein
MGGPFRAVNDMEKQHLNWRNYFFICPMQDKACLINKKLRGSVTGGISDAISGCWMGLQHKGQVN